jgi:hypothetical protein
MKTLWILGAPGTEMDAIEGMIRVILKQEVAYAVVGVDRVTPANAMQAERAHYIGAFSDSEEIERTEEEMGHEAYPQTGTSEIWVECDGLLDRRRALNDACEIIEVTRTDLDHMFMAMMSNLDL